MIGYNENDGFAVQWLRNLVIAGHIPKGNVDARSIEEIQAGDCAETMHFFAGIGGWPYALRLAGWADDAGVWTGSCPCQPFSVAGRGAGADDARHLWPAWFRLIAECRPATIFGEQVASADGRIWLTAVQIDLETLGYAFGAADLCAAGVGAPHIRQRLYWCAMADGVRPRRQTTESITGTPECFSRASNAKDVRRSGDVADTMPAGRAEGRPESGPDETPGRGGTGELADATGQRRREKRRRGPGSQERESGVGGRYVADDERHGSQGRKSREDEPAAGQRQPARESATSFWLPCDWLPCRDGKARPIEPGTFPLAHGIPNRVGRLRGYGNAIVPQLAAQFIRVALGESIE